MPRTQLTVLALFLFQVFSGIHSVMGASPQGPRVEPWEGPDILGKVEEISKDDSDPEPAGGTILVRTNGRHQVYLRIDSRTILAGYRRELRFGDLTVGQRVAVWLRPGPRYPVFPLQASAARLALIEDSSQGGSLERFAERGAIRVGGKVQEGKLIHRVEPVYPLEASRRRVQGNVILQVLVNREGWVEETRVIRGSALLQQAAVDAVLQWRYRSTVWEGAPVSVIATVVVPFRLSPN